MRAALLWASQLVAYVRHCPDGPGVTRRHGDPACAPATGEHVAPLDRSAGAPGPTAAASSLLDRSAGTPSDGLKAAAKAGPAEKG